MKQTVKDSILALALTAAFFVSATNTSVAYSSNKMLESAKTHGVLAVKATQELQTLMESNIGSTEMSTNIKINHYFNKTINYTTDQQLYNTLDYWASPMESFQRGRGDCEDYSIAKYFTLLASGIPMEKLRMVYVKATTSLGVEGHMVLAYYPSPEQEPVILDNLIADIKPASERTDLKPVYSFNSQGLWTGVGGNTAGDPMTRISKWRDAVEKVKTEGFL
jgi:hypothetical protein